MADRLRVALASGNAHKLTELRRTRPDWEVELLIRGDYPPETGVTYRDNARVKAAHGRAHADPGSWVVGEDAGVEATALGGRPGVESARWADDGVSRLLDVLDGKVDRRARYVCAMVAIGPRGEEIAVEATLAGEIVGPPRGDEGFGYDPIFVPLGESCTVAELGDAWKARHSARARAAALLADAIASALARTP